MLLLEEKIRKMLEELKKAPCLDYQDGYICALEWVLTLLEDPAILTNTQKDLSHLTCPICIAEHGTECIFCHLLIDHRLQYPNEYLNISTGISGLNCSCITHKCIKTTDGIVRCSKKSCVIFMKKRAIKKVSDNGKAYYLCYQFSDNGKDYYLCYQCGIDFINGDKTITEFIQA